MNIENYESGKKRKTQQLVASSDTPNIGKGIKGRNSLKRRSLKFNCENVPSNGNKISPRSRQTVLSEYFTSPDKSSPKQTPLCKPDPDSNDDNGDTQQMVNIPRLLSQLFQAQVVLKRIQPSVRETTEPVKRRQSDTTTDRKNGVQRYCCKCKILEMDYADISKCKLCRRCGTLLVFVCTKCNISHFIQNKHMRKHFLTCKGNNEESAKDVLDSIAFFSCANCSFMTTHEKTLIIHVKHMGHKMLKGEKDVKGQPMKEEDMIEENHRKKFIVKHNADSTRKGIKRYCTKCKKVVAGYRTKNDDTCVVCNTRLLFKCGKCNLKCNFYKTIYNHVKAKCYPSIYRCKKCDFTSSMWQTMYNHLKSLRCSTLPNGKIE